jgi:hypothetical protein
MNRSPMRSARSDASHTYHAADAMRRGLYLMRSIDMSTTVHMYSADSLSFDCDDDSAEPSVWIRSRRKSISISLKLSFVDRQELINKLLMADAVARVHGGKA